MTQPDGSGPMKMRFVLLAIVGLLIAYPVVRVIERSLATLPESTQLIVLVSVGAVAFAGRRYLARDRVRREHEHENTHQHERRSQSRVEAVMAELSATVRAANATRAAPNPAPVVGDRRRWDAGFLEANRPAPPDTAIRREVAPTKADVEAVLGQFSSMCEMVAQHLDEDRRQTQELMEVISRRPARIEVSPEICYLDNDGWVGDIEIIDLTRSDETVRYWIRRKSDGYIFPRSFDASEVRL